MPEDLILHDVNITKLLREKYAELKKPGWIALLNAPIENYEDINTEAVRVLTEDLGYQGIYITVNKCYPELLKILSEGGLDTDKLYFIDAISQTYGEISRETKKCKYVFGPLNTEKIVESARDFLLEMKGEEVFVFLDSITTILLYNHLARTIRFSNFLTQTLKELGITGIMVSIASGMTARHMIEEIEELCDEVIYIGGEG